MPKEEILPDALYTTEEAADLLGLSVVTIQKYIREKMLEAVLIGGKWYRVPGSSLLKFIDESKTYKIVPCSWKLQKNDGKWTPRADIIENRGSSIKVTNWEWPNELADSKEAADFIARWQAKRKLIRDGGIVEHVAKGDEDN